MPQTNEESNRKILPQILAEELKHIKGREIAADAKLEEVFDKLHKEDLTALCFSGGGIRSATFGLGIVQALAKHGLLSKFDYLSTVSGGGYMGSWLSAWVRREQLLKLTLMMMKPMFTPLAKNKATAASKKSKDKWRTKNCTIRKCRTKNRPKCSIYASSATL